MDSQHINEGSTQAGVEDFVKGMLDLSDRHYHRDGCDLLESVESEELARKQFSRLFGVMVKQPFTVEVPRRKSKKTKSVIALRWQEEAATGPRRAPTGLPTAASDSWQAKFLLALAKDERPEMPDEDALRVLLTDARYESRLGEHIFRAFRRYLCDGGPKQAAVIDAVAKARNTASAKAKKGVAGSTGRKGGLQKGDLTVAGMKFQAASLIAASVAHVLPSALAIYAFPLIGGISFMLLQVGLDGFCTWSTQMEKKSELREVEEEDKVSG